MQIYASKLNQYIGNTKYRVFLIHGGEPVQTIESNSIIKTKFAQCGYDEITVIDFREDKNLTELTNASEQLGLFATKKIIELKLNSTINQNTRKILNNFITNLPEGLVFIITSEKLSAKELKSNWFLACCKFGLVINASPIPQNQLLFWIRNKLNSLNIKVCNEALNLLAYYYEGNLVACNDAINKIYIYHNAKKYNGNNLNQDQNLNQNQKELTINEIKQYIDDNARFKNFDLIDPLLDGDINRTLHILKCLKEQKYDPILVLWVICNETRTLLKISEDLQKGEVFSNLCNKYKVWNYRIPKVKKSLERLTINSLENILQQCRSSDIIVKGIMNDNPWNVLQSLCLTFLKNLSKSSSYE